MPLTSVEKSEIVSKHAHHQSDTGSPEVQIALLTENIKRLSAHFKDHTKDRHSRRGLLRQVNLRRKLLSYLKKRNPAKYVQILSLLGLRK